MIRKAKEEDLKRIKKIVYDCAKVMPWRQSTKEWLRGKYTLPKLKKLLKKSEFFVYERAGRVIASIRLEKDGIHTLYVSPEYHQTKIGTRMMKHIENFAKQKDMKKMKLYSLKTAVDFYKKLGYKIINKRSGLMTKKI